ncbi:siderophore-interacting protein [Brevibacterium sp. LE-L]|uniref:siderophore-interacting protein n=1 Tax=Brevibacterium sp. LE-L TaxID=3418557 RepID=UPI003CF94E6A
MAHETSTRTLTDDARRASANNRSEEAALRGADHDRNLHDSRATVTRLEYPSERLLRFTARLESGADDPAWASPNVTIRMELGEDFDDASRIYTIREFSAASAEIVVDVVLHGESSPMMRWARNARIGTVIAFRGPRQHFIVPEAKGRRAALFLDSTAIPALFAMVKHWPTGVQGTAVIESDDEVAVAELKCPPGLEVLTVVPGSATGLSAHARMLESPEEHVVWAAGERDAMREIRKHFRKEVGLEKDDVAVFGYWKRGVTNTEIDSQRLHAYKELLSAGGNLDDLDDSEISI